MLVTKLTRLTILLTFACVPGHYLEWPLLDCTPPHPLCLGKVSLGFTPNPQADCGLEWSAGLPGGGGTQAKPDRMADAAPKSFLMLLLLLSAFRIHHAFPSALEDGDYGFPLTLWKAD